MPAHRPPLPLGHGLWKAGKRKDGSLRGSGTAAQSGDLKPARALGSPVGAPCDPKLPGAGEGPPRLSELPLPGRSVWARASSSEVRAMTCFCLSISFPPAACGDLRMETIVDILTLHMKEVHVRPTECVSAAIRPLSQVRRSANRAHMMMQEIHCSHTCTSGEE